MKMITVAAAVILNADGKLLVVRKQGTDRFMQVGGKLEAGETPEQTMQREIREEIGCSSLIRQYIGCFETEAANEADHLLVAHLYFVELDAQPEVSSEIAELKWISWDEQACDLAPLTELVVKPWCRQYYLKLNQI